MLSRTLDLAKRLCLCLNTVSQWTQVLSTNGNATILLMSLAIKKIGYSIEITTSHMNYLKKKAIFFINDFAESLHDKRFYFSEGVLEC